MPTQAWTPWSPKQSSNPGHGSSLAVVEFCIYRFPLLLCHRRRSAQFRSLKKKVELKSSSLANPPSLPNLQYGLPYRLESLSSASLARTAVSALKKKGADVNFISDLCGAAEDESAGNMHWVTKKLAKRKTERRFHQFFSRSLPKVTKLNLPLLLNKKKKLVATRPCSKLVEHEKAFNKSFLYPSKPRFLLT